MGVVIRLTCQKCKRQFVSKALDATLCGDCNPQQTETAAVEPFNPLEVSIIAKVEIVRMFGRSKPGVRMDHVGVLWPKLDAELVWQVGPHDGNVRAEVLAVYIQSVRENCPLNLGRDALQRVLANMIVGGIVGQVGEWRPDGGSEW